MPLNSSWNAYPYPNVTGFYDIITYANTSTDMLFSSGLVVTLWIIFFIIFRKKGEMIAFSTASFLTMTISSALWAIGLVNEVMILALAVMLGISILFVNRGWREVV